MAQALAAARRVLAQSGTEAEGASVWSDPDCGNFGQTCAPTQVLQDGDRVELYRPLQVDPKESRRNRAQAGRGRQGRR